MFLHHLNAWIRADHAHSISTYGILGGRIGARRMRFETQIGSNVEGNGLWSALQALESQVSDELNAPTEPHHEIPAKAPETIRSVAFDNADIDGAAQP
jgi:hypothetical protein